MPGLRLLQGLCLTLCTCGMAFAQPTPFDEDAAQALFDGFAVQFPALNATVIVEGEIIWEAEGGSQRSPEDSVNLDYNFYSIAKMLTGMAYARLEHTSDLDIDQSVRAIDPSLPSRYDDVTLRQLLSHTAGVRHYRSDRDWVRFSNLRCETPSDALDHFIDDRLANRPGRRHEYTTFGFTLLSHLLVVLTETESFDEAMTAALGEHYLALTDSDDALKATPYIEEDGEWVAHRELNAQCKFGGGGLIASSRDLARMGSALAAGEIVPTGQFGQLTAPFVTTRDEEVLYVYGMSAGFSQNFQSNYAMHSGGSPGGRGYLNVILDRDISVGLTGNADGPSLPNLAIGLARLAAGLELEQAE